MPVRRSRIYLRSELLLARTFTLNKSGRWFTPAGLTRSGPRVCSWARPAGVNHPSRLVQLSFNLFPATSSVPIEPDALDSEPTGR